MRDGETLKRENAMRIITCAGYFGTGSSAVTDFVTEFDTVKSLGDYEFRFLHDPDGIADLEYHLVENHNRHNSGHALKRYKKLVDFHAGNRLIPRYEPYFHGQWRKISYEYIDSLTDLSYRGWWQYDLIDRGVGYYYRKLLINKLYKMTFGRHTEHVLNVLPHEITYCSYPTKEQFTAKTKLYLKRLMEAANPENAPMLMVDQLLPSSSLERYLPYFDDVRVVVVERDPRDIYTQQKFLERSAIVPTDTVEQFCAWYRYTRAHRKTEAYDPERVLLVWFEDLIYRYEETTRRISEFLGLKEENHAHKKENFVPAKSIKNTRQWERYDIGEDIAYIEKELAEYIYDYSAVMENME